MSLEGETFERVGLKDAVLGSRCTSVEVYTAIKIAARWVVTGVNMLHSPSFFQFSYILPICKATNSRISLNFIL